MLVCLLVQKTKDLETQNHHYIATANETIDDNKMCVCVWLDYDKRRSGREDNFMFFLFFVGKRVSFNDRAFVSIHKTKIIQTIIIIINQLNQSPYQKIFLALLHVIFFLFSSFFLWFLFCFVLFIQIVT